MSEPVHRYLATVGTFDGLHQGHLHLLSELVHKAKYLSLEPLVITFDAHPLSVVGAGSVSPPSLIDGALKLEKLSNIVGDSNVKVLHMSPELLRLTGLEFFNKIQADYGVEAVLMGFNNHIGSDRTTASGLKAQGVPVYEATAAPGQSRSSSLLRRAVAKCNMDEVYAILGHPYYYRGRVVHGKHLGSTIGFPTANIAGLEKDQLLPPDGVYFVAVNVDGKIHEGIANIGTCPTIDASNTERSLEVYILGLDASADLYGEFLGVYFLSFYRSEKRFGTIEALKTQLEADRQAAVEFFEPKH